MPCVQDGLNDPRTPLKLVERLFLFTNIYFHSEDVSRGVLRSIINGLDQDRLLAVLLFSEMIQRDLELVFTVLMSFDNKSIDTFFAQTQNAASIATGFVSLPEYLVRDILMHNVILFDYLRSILHVHVDANKLAVFNQKFSREIALTKKVNKYVELYRQLHDQMGDDLGLRLALLVQIIGRLGPEAPLFFERCVFRGVVIPEMEMLMARAAVENPTFSQVLVKLKDKHIPGIERLDDSEAEATIQLF
jgi:hypothetical protein